MNCVRGTRLISLGRRFKSSEDPQGEAFVVRTAGGRIFSLEMSPSHRAILGYSLP